MTRIAREVALALALLDGGRAAAAESSNALALTLTATEMSVSPLRLASGKIAMFSAIKHGVLDYRRYLRPTASCSPGRRPDRAAGEPMNPGKAHSYETIGQS
jgi:hypothetical protein